MATALNWSDFLEYVALTDVGMRRANNQDAHAEVLAPDSENWTRRGHLFVVCDGMGAHAAGELASKIAADGIPHTYLKLRDRPAADALRKSIEEVNFQIHSRGQANADFQGMGTTASALVLLPDGAVVAHVGDSRVYRLRGKRLEQLTFDHSLVWEMSAAGQVPKDALPGFVPKNIITRSLGPHADVQVDLEGPYPLEAGDIFLLCSDGLSGQVRDDEIGAILQCLPPAESAQVLIDLANLRGGPDNSTVIIVRLKSAAASPNGGQNAEPPSPETLAPGPASSVPSGKALWLLAILCIALAVGLAAAGLHVPAVAALVVGVALVWFGWVQRGLPAAHPTRHLATGARLGRGPHTMLDCEPDDKFVGELVSMIEQLREAATEEHWSIDWQQFDTHNRQGKEAASAHDYRRAVREYATALGLIMQQLRQQRERHNPAGP